MKLMLLLPNLVLIAISGINLENELSVVQINKNLSVIALHLSVLVMCVVFTALIIKSMFKVVEVENNEYADSNKGYEELALKHSVRL